MKAVITLCATFFLVTAGFLVDSIDLTHPGMLKFSEAQAHAYGQTRRVARRTARRTSRRHN